MSEEVQKNDQGNYPTKFSHRLLSSKKFKQLILRAQEEQNFG